MPYAHDMSTAMKGEKEWSMAETAALSFSQSAGAITEILPARVIVHHLVAEAASVLQGGTARVKLSRL